MTQPSYVPIAEADQMRPALRLRDPRRWTQDRPGELRSPDRPRGRLAGAPGPDQGYALVVAEQFSERLLLAENESAHDALYAAAMIAAARAALYGRAPVARDVELGLSLLGYLSAAAPRDLVEWRLRKVQALAHHYDAQRELVGAIPAESLRLTPAEAARQVEAGRWRELLGA